MKLLISLLFLTGVSSATACPFSKRSNQDLPNDETHRYLRSRRILSSVSEDEKTRSAIAEVIELSREKIRSLQNAGGCVSTSIYDSIRDDIVTISTAITDVGDKGHFFGGIVRLAAHDFMDFDRNAVDDPTSQTLGSDGCIDFSHAANAGLPDLWCDDPVACPFKALYDSSYAFMSKADFWVAAANAVVHHTSNANLILPFNWGRIDNNSCDESSARLPEPHGCSQVEETFLNRMGLSWRDAVALMGAHTLGRGDIRFSGHDGTWVDSDEESIIFDKRFYEEVLRRAWRPRQTAAGVNWTWGGNNRGVMMLNTDICLFYDIPEGDNQNCPTADNVRPEAIAAFREFLGGTNLNNNNNQAFYSAFSEAWVSATENGYSNDDLFDVLESCAPTEPTSQAPSIEPAPVSNSPTPTPTTPTPTISTPTPTTPSSEICGDFEGSFQVLKKDGSIKTLTCDRISLDKCTKHGHLCRNTCGVCDCLLGKMQCTTGSDCCSGVCKDDGKCKMT